MTPLDAVTCAALAGIWPWNPAMGDGGLDEEACLFANFDVAGRLDTTFPDPGIQSRALLTRSRVELGIASKHNVLGRLAVDGRQSAPESGYIGLEGESVYARVQIAEARYVLPRFGVSVAAGLIDDPWVITGNQSWDFRPLAPIQAEREFWSDRSDYGGAITWIAPKRLVSVTASMLSGEGLQRRERNDGKDLHGLIEVRPLAAVDPVLTEALVVTLYGREGSRGVGQARDHRLGGRLHGRASGIGYGGAIYKAWGVLGDPDRVPFGAELWATADVDLLTAAVRADFADQRPGTPQTNDLLLMAAVGVRPPERPQRPAHLMVGVQHQRLGALSAPVAGGDGTATSTTLFAQLGINLVAQTPLGPQELP